MVDKSLFESGGRLFPGFQFKPGTPSCHMFGIGRTGKGWAFLFHDKNRVGMHQCMNTELEVVRLGFCLCNFTLRQ